MEKSNKEKSLHTEIKNVPEDGFNNSKTQKQKSDPSENQTPKSGSNNQTPKQKSNEKQEYGSYFWSHLISGHIRVNHLVISRTTLDCNT